MSPLDETIPDHWQLRSIHQMWEDLCCEMYRTEMPDDEEVA